MSLALTLLVLSLILSAYLVRHEIIAMHTTGQPQVYPVCFQANLVSSGSVVPTLTTTFPEAYTINADFETWNLYGGDQTAFVAPGPGIYSGGGTSAGTGIQTLDIKGGSSVSAVWNTWPESHKGM